MALNRLSSGFSWADDVEEEERNLEEEKEKSSKRPNPFGSARPREKVLEEKGIDWRKLDEQLNHSSRDEKELKENIPAAIVLTEKKESSPPKFRCLRQIPPPTKNGRYVPEHRGQTSVSRKPIEQDLSALVPPLMYPPRNIMALMAEMQNSRQPDSRNMKRSNCYQSRRQLNELNMELDMVKGNFADSNSTVATGLNSSIENITRPFLDSMKPMRTTPQRRRSIAGNEFEQDREVERSYRKRGVNDRRQGRQGPERNFPEGNFTNLKTSFGERVFHGAIREDMFSEEDYGKRRRVPTPEAGNYNRQRR
ncbi:uncharacterized protein [Aristolochia californica]|uniref:uncharacterized protein n=1 Tax=Aristolochia californica TaxID=171875 RepID=UPI0035E26749